MNGPEHYAEAERLIEESKVLGNGGRHFPSDPNVKAERLARAQVHASLAQTAALAQGFDLCRSFYGAEMQPGCTDWQAAIGGGPDL